MKKTLLIILPLLLIVGCSKPVEDSTLINKDGLMYLPDSDSPYSGEVFTNYDTGEKLYQGTYENGLLIEYSYLKKDGSVKEPVNGETLIDRGGLQYEVNGQKPYTGDFFVLYEDGGRRITGSLKGGKLDKLWTFRYESGQKYTESTFKDGKEDGLKTKWYEDGQKYEEGTVKDGEKDGKWIYWYKNGQKKSEKTFKDGRIDGLVTWWYENGQKKSEGINKGWENSLYIEKYGLWTEWYENGQKKSEGTYKDGKKDGLWTWWFENGQKKSEPIWKDGEFISSKSWNEDGSVVVPPPPEKDTIMRK